MKRHASMNRIYRLVWNTVSNAWVAVAENSKGRGKSSSRKLVAVVLSLSAIVGNASPLGGQVVSGIGSVNQSGTTTTVNQASQNLSLNWQSFNVAANETVNFLQPSATALAVNRIYDTNGSKIMGHLNANGQVWLINPNGILFGQGSQVNVGGLVASTLDTISNNGSATIFSGSGKGGIVNQGAINGHYVAFIANNVSNAGTITSPLGAVALGAGNAVTLTFAGNDLVQMQVDGSVLNSLAQNGGLIQADGGMVIMTAGARDSLLASVVNNTGIIEARTVDSHSGIITLLGSMSAGTVNVGGTLDASAPYPQSSVLNPRSNGGFIETSAHNVKVASDANVTTAAVQGLSGTWLIDPVDFTIAASGGDETGAQLTTALGGGNVTIQSSSGASGTSGNINVNDTVSWSANTLTLNAQNNINIDSVMNGSGTASLALQYGQGAVASGNTSTYNVNAPVNLPAGHYFSTKLGSDGTTVNCTVVDSLGAAGDASSAPSTMTLQGMAATPTGNYVLGANIDATATSGWNSGAGFAPIGYPGAKFIGIFDGLGHTINNLVINQPSSSVDIGLIGMTGYSGVGATIRNVGLVGGSVTGGTNVGALVGYNFGGGPVSNSYATGSVSGTTYVGGLVGYSLQATVSNSHAAGNVNGGSDVGGLVGYSYYGTISNSHATGNVTGTGNYVGGLNGGDSSDTINNSYASGNVSGGGNVGGLAGANSAVSNSYATGSVHGNSFVGGLAGQVTGTVSNSYATGSVVGTTTAVGGLIGDAGSTVSNSYATGSVSGTGNDVGGLVGMSGGAISDSYASGSVSGSSYVGGLIGNAGSTVSNSYATGSVSGTSNVGGLMGISSSTVTNSFWDITTSGQATSAGATGMTTAQMQTQANFTSATSANGNVNPGWDFAGTWGMVAGSYPYLRAFNPSAPTVVSGLAYKGAGDAALASTSSGAGLVSLLVDGKNIGAATTGANGYYYFLLPTGTVQSSGSQILAYTATDAASGAANGASLAQNATSSVANLDVLGNYRGYQSSAST